MKNIRTEIDSMIVHKIVSRTRELFIKNSKPTFSKALSGKFEADSDLFFNLARNIRNTITGTLINLFSK